MSLVTCGERLILIPSGLNAVALDLSDFLVMEEKPWLLTVWEPLRTKAPCPDKTQPYCCYLCTVIFYVLPWTARPFHRFWRDSRGRLYTEKPGASYEMWDQIETRLHWDSLLIWKGREFECGGGSVLWRGKRWWMKHWAQRRQVR